MSFIIPLKLYNSLINKCDAEQRFIELVMLNSLICSILSTDRDFGNVQFPIVLGTTYYVTRSRCTYSVHCKYIFICGLLFNVRKSSSFELDHFELLDNE